MNNRLLHTPEGVRDIYNGEFRRKQAMTEKLFTHIRSYGYAPIQTPVFEFFDIFSREVGTTPSTELYKFFDRDGHTLVLRPDFTPSIARAASKYFEIEKESLRLCYEGSVFRNNLSLQGRLKESAQLGVEYFGESSVDSDAEILTMAVESLKLSGLKEFQISLGHAGIFRSLIEAAGFDEEEEEEIRNLIFNHNTFGVEEFLTGKQIEGKLRELFTLILKMYTTPGDFGVAVELAGDYPKLKEALLYLKELNEVLVLYGADPYITFELGLISSYSYYTGIIFSGYSYGSGEPIVKGGRYDRLMQYFKKDAPAIGFAIEMDSLLLALDRQKLSKEIPEEKTLILYTKEHRKEAIEKAVSLRKEGRTTELVKCESEEAVTDCEKRTSEEKEDVSERQTVIVYK